MSRTATNTRSPLSDTLQFLWGGVAIGLATALVCGSIAYVASSTLAPSFTATSTLYSMQGNIRVNSLNYTTTLLDADAYAIAAMSDPVLRSAAAMLTTAGFDGTSSGTLGRALQVTKAETSTTSFVYISATASSPELAAESANAVARALIQWDAARTQLGVSRTIEVMEAQLAALSSAGAEEEGGNTSAALLAANLAQTMDLSTQITVLRAIESQGIATLATLESASPPSTPSGPRVVMNALLGFMFGLVVGYAVVLIGQVIRGNRVSAPSVAFRTAGK